MYRQQIDIRDKLKPIERRLAVLDTHIQEADNYLKHKMIYRQYQEQSPRQKEAFLQKHGGEFLLFEAAERYLHGVMNGKTTLPMKAWKAERAKLTAEQKVLDQQYAVLKEEVHEVEQIRRSVHSIMREETSKPQPKRKKDLNL